MFNNVLTIDPEIMFINQNKKTPIKRSIMQIPESYAINQDDTFDIVINQISNYDIVVYFLYRNNKVFVFFENKEEEAIINIEDCPIYDDNGNKYEYKVVAYAYKTYGDMIVENDDFKNIFINLSIDDKSGVINVEPINITAMYYKIEDYIKVYVKDNTDVEMKHIEGRVLFEYNNEYLFIYFEPSGKKRFYTSNNYNDLDKERIIETITEIINKGKVISNADFNPFNPEIINIEIKDNIITFIYNVDESNFYYNDNSNSVTPLSLGCEYKNKFYRFNALEQFSIKGSFYIRKEMFENPNIIKPYRKGYLGYIDFDKNKYYIYKNKEIYQDVLFVVDGKYDSLNYVYGKILTKNHKGIDVEINIYQNYGLIMNRFDEDLYLLKHHNYKIKDFEIEVENKDIGIYYNATNYTGHKLLLDEEIEEQKNTLIFNLVGGTYEKINIVGDNFDVEPIDGVIKHADYEVNFIGNEVFNDNMVKAFIYDQYGNKINYQYPTALELNLKIDGEAVKIDNNDVGEYVLVNIEGEDEHTLYYKIYKRKEVITGPMFIDFNIDYDKEFDIKGGFEVNTFEGIVTPINVRGNNDNIELDYPNIDLYRLTNEIGEEVPYNIENFTMILMDPNKEREDIIIKDEETEKYTIEKDYNINLDEEQLEIKILIKIKDKDIDINNYLNSVMYDDFLKTMQVSNSFLFYIDD